jgi:ABC-type antimicrobial peptide transport system permease subunit
MGRFQLICRLAARDTRRHLAQAILLLLAITATTTVLTLGLALSGVTSHPYQQTRAATDGPDVVATLVDPGQATPLIHASGVTRSSGPYPILDAVVRMHGLTAGAEAEGRAQAPVAVDQPELLSGSWVRPGGVVIERAYAEALGARVGDHLTINGKQFTVAGIAVSAARAPFPNICYSGCFINSYLFNAGIGAKQMGLVWMTEPDVTKLASAADPIALYALNLRLSSPGQAQAFASEYGSGNNAPLIEPWQQIASAYALLVSDEQTVLTPGAVLLGLLALASVAVLVGGRLAQNRRRVGLLKAAGGSPGLIAATFLAENLVLALIAAAIGLAAGRLAAPLLTNPGAGLVGTPGAPALTATTVAAVVGVARAVARASSLVPANTAPRSSTVTALADSARPARRHGSLIRLSRRLPVPALFGLRLAARRPRRTLLSAAGIAVTVSGIVAMLTFHATVGAELRGMAATNTRLPDPIVSRDEQMLAVITVALVALAVITAILTAWATVLDARRASALMRALGTTTRQVSSGLASAQLLAALPGAIVGVPLGIGLFKVLSKGATTMPDTMLLIATVIGTLIVVAVLTTIPARIAARAPAPQVLQGGTD